MENIERFIKFQLPLSNEKRQEPAVGGPNGGGLKLPIFPFSVPGCGQILTSTTFFLLAEGRLRPKVSGGFSLSV